MTHDPLTHFHFWVGGQRRRQWSEWTVVSFTVERWIVVFHPLKRHRLCTRKRAITAMLSLTVVSLLFYSFSLFTTSVRYIRGLPVCVTLKHNTPLQVCCCYYYLLCNRTRSTEVIKRIVKNRKKRNNIM